MTPKKKIKNTQKKYYTYPTLTLFSVLCVFNLFLGVIPFYPLNNYDLCQIKK